MTRLLPVRLMSVSLLGFKSTAAALLLGLTALIAGCGGDGGTNVVPDPTLVSISVSPTGSTLAVGLSQQFTATGV